MKLKHHSSSHLTLMVLNYAFRRPKKVDDVVEVINKKPSRVYESLDILTRNGLARRSGPDTWVITMRGIDTLHGMAPNRRELPDGS